MKSVAKVIFVRIIDLKLSKTQTKTQIQVNKMFKVNQKVKLIIGSQTFIRTVSEIYQGAVYLAEGGDAFDDKTGKVFGGSKLNKFITA